MDTFCDLENVPQSKNLDELITHLHKVFEEENINVEYVNALLQAYKSDPKDWKQFAKFDQHRYTRNLVDRGNGKFNLMALCWSEQQGSSIHDHSNSHCFVKILEGELREVMFSWPDEETTQEAGEMKQTDTNTCKRDEVAYINDSMGLHRMENPSHTNRTVSLHLYCPPFDSCCVFDERTSHKTTARVTFYSQFGKRTPFTVEKKAEEKACCGDLDVAENN